MSHHRINRRTFGLAAVGAATATLGAGDAAAPPRRFIFVQAGGGWDPLHLFAPMFDSPLIQMDPTAERMQIGSFQLVGGPSRDQAVDFFQRFGDRTLLLNGLSTRSVNHQACMAIANTGSLAPHAADWATLLGADASNQFLLPHLVLDGATFPGEHHGAVSRAQGMLADAVHGTVSSKVAPPVAAPGATASGVVDQYLASRAQAAARDQPAGTLLADHADGILRAQALVANKDLVSLSAEGGTDAQAASAIHVLATGLSRCATLISGVTTQVWDTHSANASGQTTLFNGLFRTLIAMMDGLAATPSPEGTALSESTVIVVLSEMGRTPAFNENQGRDHWPFTSALIIGPGITGGRTIGGFTDGYSGIGADPATGELDHARRGITAEDFGATLLALGGIDPAEVLPNADPITAVLT